MVEQLAGLFRQAKEADSAERYAALAEAMSSCEAQLREQMQAAARERLTAVIQKLKTTAPITEEELALIKLWVVGDAESYVKVENSLGEWRGELQRLLGEISQLKSAPLDTHGSFRLRALLRDGLRVAWDVHHFLEHKERVERFNESTRELDREERTVLADILSSKLRSDTY